MPLLWRPYQGSVMSNNLSRRRPLTPPPTLIRNAPPCKSRPAAPRGVAPHVARLLYHLRRVCYSGCGWMGDRPGAFRVRAHEEQTEKATRGKDQTTRSAARAQTAQMGPLDRCGRPGSGGCGIGALVPPTERCAPPHGAGGYPGLTQAAHRYIPCLTARARRTRRDRDQGGRDGPGRSGGSRLPQAAFTAFCAGRRPPEPR